MTTTQRPRPPRQAPPGSSSASRGLILVVVAVVIGAILLIKGGGVGFETDSNDIEIGTGSDEPAATGSTVTTSTAPATSVAPAALKVVVLNAAGVNGYAGTAATFLNVAGYPTVGAETAGAQAATTTVYFAPGYEGDAMAIATLLSVGAVQPLPEGTVLGKAAEDVPADTNVVVVLGPDVQGIISTSATATATTTVAGSSGGSAASTIPASGGQSTTTEG